MIIAADIHLREESADTVFTSVLPGLFEATRLDSDNLLVILGDFWHVRYRVSVRLQNLFMEFLEKLNAENIKVILLPGNHDQINPKGENALQVFQKMPNVMVYSEPTLDRWGLWIPYRKNLEEIKEALSAKPRTTRTVFMHHGVRGALMNGNIRDNDGLELSEFENSDHILCGHYHMRQKLGPVHYIGSPYQTRADEAGQAKGYARWNGKSLTYIDTKWGKRYHRYVVKEVDTFTPDEINFDDELRIQVNSAKEAELLGKKLIAAGYKNVVVTPKQSASQKRLEVNEAASLSEYAIAFVNAQDTYLDKKELLNTYKEITRGYE